MGSRGVNVPSPDGTTVIYIARSKIAGRGVFTNRLIRPGHHINDLKMVAGKTGFNHSCDPNCIIVRDSKGHVESVIALRFITKGEELTLDYRTARRRRLHPTKVMRRLPKDCKPCRCPKCRITA